MQFDCHTTSKFKLSAAKKLRLKAGQLNVPVVTLNKCLTF
jgi:hypothetical protein